MQKTTAWPQLLRRFTLCLGLIGMSPILAFAASSPNGVNSPDKPAMDDIATVNAQTLAEKPDMYLQLIAGIQQRGLYYASLAHLDVFEARWPGQADAALLRANALRESGQTEAAKALYDSLLHGPQAARANHGLGLIAVRGGRFEEGSAALNRAAALAPTDATILGDQGYAFLMLEKFEDARLALFKAAELDAGNKRIGANLALLLALSGRLEQAQQLMQRYELAPHAREEILARAAEAKTERKPTTEHPQ